LARLDIQYFHRSSICFNQISIDLALWSGETAFIMASKSSGMEAFPPLEPEPGFDAHSSNTPAQRPTRARRVSSLRGDPRGDTGATSIATSNLAQVENIQQSPPLSPILDTANEKSSRVPAKRRRGKSWFSKWKRMSLKHTWVNPLIVILGILGAYIVRPGEDNPLHAAIFLSYANPPLYQQTNTLPAHVGNPTQYGKGLKDLAFFGFYTIVLSFTREFLMQCLIRPIAIRAGILNRARQARFMEQCYTAVYFGIFGPYGLYVMSRTPMWFFNTEAMYVGFPHRAHDAYFKAYYLLQASYWAQQGLVMLLMLEKPRKDFKELVLHHIVTLALIGLSYRFHFTYIGLIIYITMDVSDFFLAVSYGIRQLLND
jgi:acyl-CoA-dependent ceramide synthase